jgi:hypothetical protein
MLDQLAQLEPARLRPVVEAHAEQLLQNERLATLRIDVPLGAPPHVSPLGQAAIENLRHLFRELEFKSMEARLDSLAEAIETPLTPDP